MENRLYAHPAEGWRSEHREPFASSIPRKRCESTSGLKPPCMTVKLAAGKKPLAPNRRGYIRVRLSSELESVPGGKICMRVP